MSSKSATQNANSFGRCATISKATKVISVLDRNLAQQKRRMVSTRRRKVTGFRRILSQALASRTGGARRRRRGKRPCSRPPPRGFRRGGSLAGASRRGRRRPAAFPCWSPSRDQSQAQLGPGASEREQESAVHHAFEMAGQPRARIGCQRNDETGEETDEKQRDAVTDQTALRVHGAPPSLTHSRCRDTSTTTTEVRTCAALD